MRVLSAVLLLGSLPAFGQQPVAGTDSVQTAAPNYRLLHGMFAAQTVLYGGTLYGLSKAWYEDPLTRFHVADDFSHWRQMDKAGHLFSAYQIARHTTALYRKTGITKRQAVVYGAISGFFFQTPIEILDGFSPDYGFSPSDLAANLAGAALFVGQHALWDEIRIQPKFSFRFTPLAVERPELLGRRRSEQWLKDYNGQTYWLSASPGLFRARPGWPPWLCLSVGYGIQDMVAAEVDKNRELGYRSYRQYYLSVDIDLTRIPTRRKWVRTLVFLANSLKVPAPALSLSRKGVRFHPLYF